MSVVAMIPARGGSKRIPRKNIKLFAGKPMIAHSIEAARASGVFDHIFVSTDDDAIAEVARACGAEVPFRRPPELCDDHATTDMVIQHGLDWLEKQGAPAEFFCCLYATAPFVRAEDLRRGLDILRQSAAATAFSVTTFAYPIFRALRLDEAGHLAMFWPEHRLTRSQDLPEAFHDAGQFYWLATSRYLQEGRVFSSNSVPVRLPRHLVQDIDTPEDWERAERMFAALERPS